MENKVNKEDAKIFLNQTGYEFDSYVMTVVEMMLFDFAEQQVKIHCDKSNVIRRRELLIDFLTWYCDEDTSPQDIHSQVDKYDDQIN